MSDDRFIELNRARPSLDLPEAAVQAQTDDDEKPVIQPAIERALVREPWPPRKGKLWVSNVTKCPRQVMMRCLAYAPTDTFGAKTLGYFRLGNVYEEDTAQLLRAAFGTTRIQTQIKVQSPFWSGKMDVVIDHRGAVPIVVEHKATGDRWWNYEGNLPKLDHLAQLCLYGALYEEQFGQAPVLILYYRSWGHWAEFQAEVWPGFVTVEGWIDGEVVKRDIGLDVAEERRTLEAWHERQELPGRPPDHVDGCLFQGEPGCLYYGNCWPSPIEER